MEFAQPLWILAGIFACLVLFAFSLYKERRRQEALQRFAAAQLLSRLTGNISTMARRVKITLLLLAVLSCFVALARPQVGYQWTEVHRRGIDLLFAIDTSKSMLAQDIKPNRLQRANLAILDFVRQLQGDRVGLLPFAGTAYLMCPLTIDYDAFAHSLAAVNVKLLPQGGTNLGAAIDKAMETLAAGSNHKILIILTDGEDLSGEAVQAAERAAKEGLTIYTVGVGSSGGELIPLPDGKGFVKDNSGNYVASRLDSDTLTKIAEKSGGLYVPLGPAGEGLETIYQKKLALLPKDDLMERRQKVPIERFYWPLALALALLVIELLISERKLVFARPKLSLNMLRPRSGKKSNGTVVALLLLLPLLATGDGHASPGEDAYARGDYLQSSEYYRKRLEKDPDNPRLLYNFGTTAHKNSLYDEAIGAFAGALKSDDPSLQQKAYYNRGNSYYHKGAEMRQADAKGAATQWRQALASYDGALALDKTDSNAQYNRQLVAERLKELEKQLQQEEKQQQQQQQQQQQDTGGGEKNPDKEQNGSEESSQQEADKKESRVEQEPSQPEEESPAEPSAAERAEAERERQQKSEQQRQLEGKMTREEAERLLNAMKNEESILNFVPSSRKDHKVDKDW
jgi:Ca-activated chloride channel family protein